MQKTPSIFLASLFFVLFSLVVFLGQKAIFGQNFPRYLEDIQLSTLGGKDMVVLLFSKGYQGEPSWEVSGGVLEVNLFATGSRFPQGTLKISNSFWVKKIEVEPHASFTQVRFYPLEGKTWFKEGLSFTAKGKKLEVGFSDGALPKLLPSSPRSVEKVPTLGGGEDLFFWTLLKLFAGLAFFGLLALVLRYFLRKKDQLKGAQSALGFRLVSSFHFGPKERVVVLSFQGKWLVLGITPHQINLLLHLAPPSDTEKSNPPKKNTPPSSFEAELPSTDKDNSAQNLLEKIRSLKPLS